MNVCESAAVTLTAAAIHEFGHIAAIKLCGGRFHGIRLTFSGAEIDAALYGLSRWKRAIVYAAGALMNVISGLIGLWLGSGDFFGVSMALAAVNLLPVKMLDGGCVLAELVGCGSRWLDILTALVVFLIWLAAVVVLLFTGSVSLWVFASYLFFDMYLRRRRYVPSSARKKGGTL